MATSLNNRYEPADRYRAVVEHNSGLLVVSAGPGTGKTYSLLRRIESLIDSGVNHNQIYYLTFVNSIVDAFKNDAQKPKEDGGLGVDPEALGIHISTLHSLAFKIVKVYSNELELPSHIEMIDLSPKPQNPLSKVFVNDLFAYAKSKKVAGNKKSFDCLLQMLTEAWRQNALPNGNRTQLEQVTTLLCRRYSICSWDQLVLLAIRAISENGLPTWLQEVKHFLIDEYQDFNPAEQQLLHLITEPSDSVVIVGDPDQSIYSGRSASPQGLTNLLTNDNTKCVNFVHCRRCPSKVINAANHLLKFMDPVNYGKGKLQPFKKVEGRFEINEFVSCKKEIEHIAEILKNLDTSQNCNVIVLLPKKEVAKYYAKKLRERGINCGVKSMDTSAELLATIFRLVVLRHQTFLERVLLSLCFPNLDRKYIASVLPVFIEGEASFVDTLVQASTDQKWQKGLKNSLSSFACVIKNLTSGDQNSINIGLNDLGHTISENMVNCLLDNSVELSVGKRVELALKANDRETEGTSDSTTSIEVMTMHCSKGLSKQIVIIPAFDKKLLPGDCKGERLAEMHRLVYVAVTRAEHEVLITFPKTRARGDPLNYGAKPKISCYAKILIPPTGTQSPPNLC